LDLKLPIPDAAWRPYTGSYGKYLHYNLIQV
jgi:hypothetical protein